MVDRLHAGREERKTGRFDQDFLADADRQVLPKLHDAGVERQADEPSRKRSPREASLGRFANGKTINRGAGLFKTDKGGDDEHDDVGGSPEHRHDRELAFDYWRPFGNEIDDDPERGERDQGRDACERVGVELVLFGRATLWRDLEGVPNGLIKVAITVGRRRNVENAPTAFDTIGKYRVGVIHSMRKK